MNTRAIILAAGLGSRMGKATKSIPKGMNHVHGRPILAWEVEALSAAGIKNIAIVKGYLGHTLHFPVTYFTNSNFKTSNMVRSLICADVWLKSYPCIISYSDILYHHQGVKDLMQTNGEIVISYDPDWQTLWQKRFADPLDDAETFRQKNGRLIDIGGKTSNLEDIKGQYMGLIKITPKGWRIVKETLESCSPKQIDQLDMTALIKRMLNRNINIDCVPYPWKWYEIDSITDLELVNRTTDLFGEIKDV